ncbi:hypothetical protein C8R43DRAFT_956123 [Mycena crocata]|nr:hypothetical protein C8R43DRAFT_956123 [Mycena crocata]
MVCGCTQMSSVGAPRWSVDVFHGCTQIVCGCLAWVHPDGPWMSSMGAPRSSVDVFRGCTQMFRGYFQSVRNDRVSSYPELERKNKNEIQQPVLCVKLPFPPWVQNKPPRKGPGTRFYFSTPRQGPPYGQKKPDFSARAARGPSVTIWVHPWTSRWIFGCRWVHPPSLGAPAKSEPLEGSHSISTRLPLWGTYICVPEVLACESLLWALIGKPGYLDKPITNKSTQTKSLIPQQNGKTKEILGN